MRVTLINSISGLAVLVVAALVLPSRWGAPVLPWGVLAGVIPVTIGFVRGERLSDLGYLGLAIGLVAIVLICLVPGKLAVRPSPRGLLMAVGAGVAIGGHLVFIDLTPPDSGPAPLLVTLVVSGIVMSVALLGQRLARRGAPGRGR